MRFARYLVEGRETYGLVEGAMLVDLAGDPFDGWERTALTRPLETVRLLAPLVPGTFYAAGLNYAGHITAMANAKGELPSLPPAADIGQRAVNAICGPGDAIRIPADASDEVQYEAELVVVIGRRARNLTYANCLDCVLGYTIGNDVSERRWQREDRTMWRAKNCDSFAPMGPWIETDFDPAGPATTTVKLNGETCISFPTANMIFSVADFLVRMSRYVTLYPRDMIWMGTEGRSRNMAHGDLCAISIDGIGTLANPVVREDAQGGHGSAPGPAA